MAILTSLLATILLTALGLTAALLGIEESMLAAHERTARSLRHASAGAAELAIADLRRLAVWDAALAAGGSAQLSASPGRLWDGVLSPASPWDGRPFDLRAETDRVQALRDAARGAAEGPQAWRLFECGALAATAPGTRSPPWYLAVWVADDPADTDGDPVHDTNGIVQLRAAAFGPAGAVAVTDVVLFRPDRAGNGPVAILGIRPGS